MARVVADPRRCPSTVAAPGSMHVGIVREPHGSHPTQRHCYHPPVVNSLRIHCVHLHAEYLQRPPTWKSCHEDGQLVYAGVREVRCDSTTVVKFLSGMLRSAAATHPSPQPWIHGMPVTRVMPSTWLYPAVNAPTVGCSLSQGGSQGRLRLQ